MLYNIETIEINIENKTGLQHYLIALKLLKSWNTESGKIGIGIVKFMGPDCYQGERFKESGAWCKLNDMVQANITEGINIYHKCNDEDYCIINDDQILFIMGPSAINDFPEYEQYIKSGGTIPNEIAI